MRDAQPQAIYRSDYQPPAFFIEETYLDFELHENETLVRSRLRLRRNPEGPSGPLELEGKELELLEVAIDGRELGADEYVLTETTLTVQAAPAAFEFTCLNRILPQENTELEGLYKSRTMFCTQCEAEGFRRITYFLDRPDVMSVYTVRIEADSERYPLLLSNGNRVDSGSSPGNRHWATWHDPFPKPSYLFAMVAADLEKLSDTFITASKRMVELNIYVEAKDLDKVDYAMGALKASMRWDEEVYGREYDLDLFNIVAVDDFNMGAMENKSLNIFNTSCVLAHPATTTDANHQRVEGIVAHEYFHNWSGNRVTCRDWFQLSLKEGFTVFRDAQFSADQGSATVKRVEDVNFLRSIQFAEDAGPLAHSVRPDSYLEINNFYTTTVYEKGAEVVRMLHQLLGAELFRAGSDLYFDRHDGQAATCDDFVQAMEDASGLDLEQFRRWYSQAGTPVLRVVGQYDENARQFTLDVSQSCPDTPGQHGKDPFHIPLAMGLLGEAGELRLKVAGEAADPETSDNTSCVLHVTEQNQQFVFDDVPERPIPSLLRSFSAPVQLEYDYSREELAFIMRRDSNGFCRWDASQQLSIAILKEQIAAHRSSVSLAIDTQILDASTALLSDRSLDPAMVALMLQLPTESYLADIAEDIDVNAIHLARRGVSAAIGSHNAELARVRYDELGSDAPYAATAEQIAQRSLKNCCLAYLLHGNHPDAMELAKKQFHGASNMTDQLAALTCLVDGDDRELADAALDSFYQQWQQETLVINTWLQVQARSRHSDTVDRVVELMAHAAYENTNPNRVRSLLGVFGRANPVNFHRGDGAGYRLLSDAVIELDNINSKTAAGLLDPFTSWKRYGDNGQLMEAELKRIVARPNLSIDVFEIVNKCLGAVPAS